MLFLTQEFQTRELRSATLMSSRGFLKNIKIHWEKKEGWELSSHELPYDQNQVLLF